VPYRVWTNSKSAVKTYGGSFGFNYRIQKWVIQGNATYSKLEQSENQDGLEDGYNTPEWMIHASIQQEAITPRLGAGIQYKWQSHYYWQSFLVNDWVPAYGTIDLHFSYRIPKIKSIFKLSGSNIFNQYYQSFIGGPSIGGMYLMSVLFTP